jgi:hypothetical protein
VSYRLVISNNTFTLHIHRSWHITSFMLSTSCDIQFLVECLEKFFYWIYLKFKFTSCNSIPTKSKQCFLYLCITFSVMNTNICMLLPCFQVLCCDYHIQIRAFFSSGCRDEVSTECCLCLQLCHFQLKFQFCVSVYTFSAKIWGNVRQHLDGLKVHLTVQKLHPT